MWHALQTRPRKEDKVVAFTTTAGLRAVCPTIVEIRRVLRRGVYLLREVCLPAFPCYVFVRVDAAWPSLSSLIRDPPEKVGRVSVVSMGGVPSPIDDEVIDVLMEVGRYSSPREIRVNEKVRLDGLAGLIAVVSNVSRLVERQEITVWLDMLGVRKEVTVPAGSVAPV